VDGFLEFLSNTPLAKILFLVGIALVVLGLIRKIPLGKERAIEIESQSRRIALVVGLVFVVGAIILDPSLRGGGGNNGPTPTPAASSTPTRETATATEDPKDLLNQTVVAYYGFLNEQAYKEAWDLLSPEFQQTRQENGILGFEAYWRTVDEVEIVEFEPAYVSSSGGAGEVVVGLIYHLEDTSPNVRLRLCLVFDDFQGGWLIDRAVGIDDQC
jgi:hypothetical protein